MYGEEEAPCNARLEAAVRQAVVELHGEHGGRCALVLRRLLADPEMDAVREGGTGLGGV